MSEYRLTTEIIKLSNSKTWDEAKLEWALSAVYLEKEPETCLCGHFPINEICTIKNKLNKRSADVGNCCVKKFIGLPSDLIFQAIKRVQSDLERSLNAETIQHAFEKGWINEWEKGFYFDTMRKRNLTSKQLGTRKTINTKILNQVASGRNKTIK